VRQHGTGGTSALAVASFSAWGINLSTEELVVTPAVAGFTVAGFSVDGGDKWKAGAPTEKDITRILGRGGQLALTDKLDRRSLVSSAAASGETAAVEGSVVVIFGEVEKRERFRAVINYFPQWLNETPGVRTEPNTWVLINKDDRSTPGDITKNITGLEFRMETDKTKVADLTNVSSWAAFPTAGLPYSNWLKNERPTRATYFVRIPAVGPATVSATAKWQPASTVARLGIAPPGRAPNVRPNYKTEVVRVRAGMSISLANGAEGTYTWYPTKDDLPERGNVEITNNITNATNIKVFAQATARRPATAITTIVLAERENAPVAGNFAQNKARAVAASGVSGLQIRADNNATTKWGRNATPTAAPATSSFFARLAGAAKPAKVAQATAAEATAFGISAGDWFVGVDSGKANSVAVQVNVTWTTAETPAMQFAVADGAVDPGAETFTYNTPAALADVDGVTFTIAVTPASPVAAGTIVTVTITAGGEATAQVDGTFAVAGTGVVTTGSGGISVGVGTGVGTVTFTFPMPEANVTDLAVTFNRT
jgi:hypothetical protein